MSKDRPIISKKDARARGLRRFFDGVACPNGHIAERESRNGECVECRLAHNAYAADRPRYKRYAENHRDDINAKRRVRAEKDHERIRVVTNLYRAKNRKKVNTNQRANYWRNRDKIRRQQITYYLENPDVFKAAARNRRARLKGSEGSHTDEDIAMLLVLQKNRCAICFQKLRKKRHIDHIVPLVKKGRNDRSNLQITCPTCNHKKGPKDPIVFAQENGRLL